MDDREDPFDDIGYHYMVQPDGTIYEGRFLAHKGSHVADKNTAKIGILVMGSFQSTGHVIEDRIIEPRDAQIRATVSLVNTLKLHFQLKTLGGHLDFRKTECPGKLLYDRLDEIRSSTGLAKP
jgi:hypothetical protein